MVKLLMWAVGVHLAFAPLSILVVDHFYHGLTDYTQYIGQGAVLAENFTSLHFTLAGSTVKSPVGAWRREHRRRPRVRRRRREQAGRLLRLRVARLPRVGLLLQGVLDHLPRRTASAVCADDLLPAVAPVLDGRHHQGIDHVSVARGRRLRGGPPADAAAGRCDSADRGGRHRTVRPPAGAAPVPRRGGIGNPVPCPRRRDRCVHSGGSGSW